MKIVFIVKCILFCLFTFNLRAQPPQIKTPAPVIYLADNLDERDNLGWCIDTKGRGFSEVLHAHSCKPFGGDVQFSFDLKTRQIKSVEFPGKCLTADVSDYSASPGLFNCEPRLNSQKFIYVSQNGAFQVFDKAKLCLVVGHNSRSAGPFMARKLYIEECRNTPEKFRRWVIKEK